MKIGANVVPYDEYLKPEDARKGYHEVNKISFQVKRSAKARRTPTCSVSLIEAELKGLAALGEALKNER